MCAAAAADYLAEKALDYVGNNMVPDDHKDTFNNIRNAYDAASSLNPGKAGRKALGALADGAKKVGRKIKDSFPPKKRGNAARDKDGKPIELHHDGQKPDGRLDEMTQEEHRGKDNFKKNHHNTGQQPSEIDRNEFAKQRRKHWKDEWNSGRWPDDKCEK
jgi:hypothetical protein